MIPDKVIKKVPGLVKDNPKEKQGHIEDLTKVPKVSLIEILERQSKILANRATRKMFYRDQFINTQVKAATELLNHFNNDELRSILNENSRFDEVLKTTLESKDIETDKEVLMVSNKSLAEFNLTKESTIEELKREVRELSVSGEEVYKSVEAKMKRVNEKTGWNNAERVLALLKAAAATMEDESESAVESFLDGGTDVDSFLSEFIEKRKLMHLRRVKVDKMTDMITKRSVNNSRPTYPSQTPYPLAPGIMPLPGNMDNKMYFN